MSQTTAAGQSDDSLIWQTTDRDLLTCAQAVVAGRAIGFGVVVQDRSGAIVGANARAASILALTLDQLLGRTSRDPRWEAVSALGLPLTGDEHPAMQTLANGEPVEGYLMGVLVPDRQDAPNSGNTRWIEIDTEPVRSASQELLGVVSFFRDVSSGKRGRRATQALIRAYRLLAENGSDVVLMSSSDATIVWVSSSLTRVLGWDPEAFVGRHVWEFLHPDDLSAFSAVQPALANDELVTVDGRVKTADGQYRWMTARIRTLQNETGLVGTKVVSWRDIDAEHRAIDALRESEERLRLLSENADDVIWTMALDGTTTYVSPSVERLLGFTPDEVKVQSPPPMHAVSQQLWQQYWTALHEAINAGHPLPTFSGDIVHIRKDGSDMTGEVRVVPQVDSAGRAVRLLGVTRDVTEARRAELDAAQSRAELAEAQRVANVGSWTWDPAADVVVWSEELRSIYGLTPEEPTPSAAERRRFYSQETLAESDRRVAHCLTTGEPYEFEYDITRRDGSKRHLLSRCEPVRDASGAIIRLRGTAADITEQHRDAQALRASEARAQALIDELRQADAAKNDFISTLSHELRNPVAAIIAGLAQLDTASTDSQSRRTFEIVERQAQQLSRLVDDLLDVTRLTRNTITLTTEPIVLNDFIGKIANDNQSFFDSRSVGLEVRIVDAPMTVLADRTRLAQAVGNLLHNAAKFSTPHGTVTMTVAHDAEMGEAVITITDHGRGISPEAMVNLFQPFTQANRAFDSSYGGLGLGLSIVKQIVELHGGAVTAASDGPGTGSTFTLRLPLIAPVDVAPKNPSMVTPPVTVQDRDGSHQRRVLLIEDQEDLRWLTAHLLERRGYRVVGAGSGPEALAAATREHPDLILCDIGLPGMSGYEVATVMRATESLRSVPLIALTGHGQAHEVHRALSAGFDRHLVKPLDIAALEVILQQLESQRPPGTHAI